MTQTPLEKAARAVWDAREARNPIQFTRMSWETGTPLAKAMLVEDIRTALMAVREPDEGMAVDGEKYLLGCGWEVDGGRVEFTGAFTAMIDHILRGGE